MPSAFKYTYTTAATGTAMTAICFMGPGTASWARSFHIVGTIFLTSYSLLCAYPSCSPGLEVRGAGFQTRENAPVHILEGFSPGGGVSNSVVKDADDRANSSGLSLNPALTGFPQM
jgi:hypothetical protein